MTNKIARLFDAFIRDESGQDLIEYALVAVLVGLGLIVALSGSSGRIGHVFDKVGNTIANGW